MAGLNPNVPQWGPIQHRNLHPQRVWAATLPLPCASPHLNATTARQAVMPLLALPSMGAFCTCFSNPLLCCLASMGQTDAVWFPFSHSGGLECCCLQILWVPITPRSPPRSPGVSHCVPITPLVPLSSPTVTVLAPDMAEHSTVAPQQCADQGHKKSCAGIGEVPRRGEKAAGACAHPWLKPCAVGTLYDPGPFLHANS